MNNESPQNNELGKYSTKELKAELKRRAESARAARELEMKTAHRCRNCVHCVLKTYGLWYKGYECAARTYGKYNKHYVVKLSKKGCEKFEYKNQ